MPPIAKGERSPAPTVERPGRSLDDLGPTCSVEQAAEVLGISRGLAYRLASSGRLPGVLSLGTRLRVSVFALRHALQADVQDEG